MKRSDIPETSPVGSGGGVPAWLTKALPTLVQILNNAIDGEKAYPRRPELRKRFKGIEGAARLLMKELQEPQIRSLFLRRKIGLSTRTKCITGFGTLPIAPNA